MKRQSQICPSLKLSDATFTFSKISHYLFTSLSRSWFIYPQSYCFQAKSTLSFENIANFTAKHLRNKKYLGCEIFRMHFRHLQDQNLHDHQLLILHDCTFNYLFSIQIIQRNVKKGKERGKKRKSCIWVTVRHATYTFSMKILEENFKVYCF